MMVFVERCLSLLRPFASCNSWFTYREASSPLPTLMSESLSDSLDDAAACVRPVVLRQVGVVLSVIGTMPSMESLHSGDVDIRSPFLAQHSKPSSSILTRYLWRSSRDRYRTLSSSRRVLGRSGRSTSLPPPKSSQ
jgi:hypothetical protein